MTTDSSREETLRPATHPARHLRRQPHARHGLGRLDRADRSASTGLPFWSSSAPRARLCGCLLGAGSLSRHGAASARGNHCRAMRVGSDPRGSAGGKLGDFLLDRKGGWIQSRAQLPERTVGNRFPKMQAQFSGPTVFLPVLPCAPHEVANGGPVLLDLGHGRFVCGVRHRCVVWARPDSSKPVGLAFAAARSSGSRPC